MRRFIEVAYMLAMVQGMLTIRPATSLVRPLSSRSQTAQFSRIAQQSPACNLAPRTTDNETPTRTRITCQTRSQRHFGLFASCTMPYSSPSLSPASRILIAQRPASLKGAVNPGHALASAATAEQMETINTSDDNRKIVQNMLHRIRAVNFMPLDIRHSFLRFEVDGVSLGKVRPAMAKLLCSTSELQSSVFTMDESVGSITFSESVGKSVAERTAAVGTVMESLRDRGIIRGWRNELYPVASGFYEEPLFLMERVAVPFLGCLEYGVHINGYIADSGEDSIRMWMARRSPTKSKFPNMLDHIVAGGQPAGLSLNENVVKECLEEAGIPEHVTMEPGRLTPNGAVSYETYNPGSDTVSRAVIFNYDLLLPTDFNPVAVDGGKLLQLAFCLLALSHRMLDANRGL
jgi:Domain of unknown function (DUF4743)